MEVAVPTAEVPRVRRSEVPTPAEMLREEYRGPYELVDGRVIEEGRGWLVSLTMSSVLGRLMDFAKSTGAGEVVSGVTFRCFPEKPDQIRRPDLTFITAARLPATPPYGQVPVRPDGVVEILSGSEPAGEVERRVADYRSAGVPMIWAVTPKTRVVRVFRPSGQVDELREADRLDGGDVLPGFSIVVGDLFDDAD